MKIYWHSTAPWGASSYSVLTKRTVPDIVLDGHEMVIGTWHGLQGERQKFKIKRGDQNAEVWVLPQISGDNYGVQSLLPSYRMFGAEVCITVMDVWIIPKYTAEINFCPWFPVDHDPAPLAVTEALSTAIYPMCFSQWGADICKDKHGINARYVPCSADASFFTPVEKNEARRNIGLPDQDIFLVSMVAANKDPQDRKSFGEAMLAFAEFSRTRPDAKLYLHTNFGGAVKILRLAESLGLQDSLIVPDQHPLMLGGYGDEYMRELYSASDVLLSPSKSEGFGLPLIEAQMCGCPIIASDFSTTNELFAAGWKVQGQLNWTVGAESWRYMPYVGSIVECLEQAYQARDNIDLRIQARAGSAKYDTRTVYEKYWIPALEDIEYLVNEGKNVKIAA